MTRTLGTGTLLTLAIVAALGTTGCKNRHNRPGDTLTCTPGESLRIGCTHSVGTPCSGDPVIEVCDGTVAPNACTSANAIARNDDSDGLCSQVDTVCPSSGRITVNPHGYTASSSYECYWDIVHGGGTPPDGGLGGGGG